MISPLIDHNLNTTLKELKAEYSSHLSMTDRNIIVQALRDTHTQMDSMRQDPLLDIDMDLQGFTRHGATEQETVATLTL